ncbi:MAG: response regulator [Labilithrix sp.]|nr:response regulator [Labilithrix sp.]
MGLRILLLEDDPSFAFVVRSVFELDSHTVASTPNGVEALVMASREEFDLALLDIDVEELSGLGVERVLRDIDGLPVVVMSGRPHGWRREAFSEGAVACLEKPLSIERLVELTRAIEASKGSGPPFAGDVRELTRVDLDRIAKMTSREIDDLPFGAIRLDGDGRINTYNSFESNAAGLARDDVVGKRFVDIAPCIVVKEFVSTVERAREGHAVDQVLRFVFPHHRAACVVSVRLYLAAGDDQLWLFVSKRLDASR